MKKTFKLLLSFVLLIGLVSMSAMAAGVAGTVSFYDAADDSVIPSFYNETSVYARIEFQAAKSGTASVIAAQYTADGKLVKAEVLTTELAMTSGENVSYNTEDISVANAEALRIFVWEDLSSSVPVLKSPAVLEKKEPEPTVDKFTAKENLTFTHVKENGTINATLGDIFEAVDGAVINSASVEVTVSEGCTYTKNDADWTASTLSFTGTGNVVITITDNVNCNVATATVSVVEPDSVEKFDIKSASIKAEQTVKLGDLFAEKAEVTVYDEDVTVTVTDAEGNSLADKVTYVENNADWTASTLTVNYAGSIKVTISDNNFCTATVLEAEVASLDKFAAKENLTFTHVKENGTINATLGDIFEAVDGAVINSESVEVTVSEGCTYTKNDADWTASTLAFTGTGDVTITITDNVNCKVATATVTITTPAPVEKFTAKAVEMKAEQTVALGDLFAEKAGVTVYDEDITVTVTDAEGNSLVDKVVYVADASDWTASTLTVNYAGSVKVTISDNNFCTATVLEAEVAALDKFTAKENLTFTHVKENGTINATLGDIFEAVDGAIINSASVEVTVGEGCTYTKNDADWTASTLSFTGTGDVTITITDNVNCKVATATVAITTPAPVEKFTAKAVEMKAEQTVALGDLFAEKADVTVYDEDVTVTVTDAEGNSLADKVVYTANASDWTASTLTVNYAGSIKVTISDNNFCTATVLEAEVASLDKFAAKENLTFTHVKENGTIEKTLGDIFAAIDGAVINSASVEVTVSEGCTYTKNDADWTASTLSFTGTGNVVITITDNVNCNVATVTVSVVEPDSVEKFDIKSASIKAEQTVALGDLFAEKAGVTVYDEDVTVTVTDAEGNSLADKVVYTANASDWTASTLTVNYAGSIKVTISDNNFCTATVLEAEVAALDKFAAKENLTFTHVKENGTINATLGDIFTAIDGAVINSASVEVTVGDGCTYTKNDADWTASTLSFTGTGNVVITITDNVNCNTAEATVMVVEPDSAEKFDIKSASIKAEQTVALGDLFAEKAEVTVYDEDVTVTVTDAEGNSLADKVVYTANASDWTTSTLTVNYAGSIKVTISDNNFCTATVLEAEVASLDKFIAKENLTFTHVKENGTIEKTLGDIFAAVDGASINSASVEVTVSDGCTYTKNDADWTASTLAFTGTGDVVITITDNVNCNTAEATVMVVEPDYAEKFDIKSASIKAEQTVTLGDLFAEKAEVTVYDEDITVTVTDAEGNSLADKVVYIADASDWTASTLTVNYAGSIKVTISDNNFCTATVLEAEVASLDKFAAKENLTFTHVKENGTIEKTLGDIFAAVDGASINSASVEVTVSEGCTYTKNDADWTASTLAFTGTGNVVITITDNVNCSVAEATVTIAVPESVEKFTAKAVEMKAEQTVTLGDLFAEKADVTVYDEDVTVTVTDAEGNSIADKVTYVENDADWTASTLTVNYAGSIKVTISDNNFCTATVLEAEVASLDKFAAKENLTFTHVKENGTIEKTLGDIFAAIDGAVINSANVEVTVSEGCTYTKNDADWTASTLSFTGTGDVTITIAESCNKATATVTITEPEDTKKFDLVFENTDKYMYRVGNGGVDANGNPVNSPVALTSLFKVAEGSQISDGVTVTVEPVNGDNVVGNTSADEWTASNWTNGKIEFNNTGIVKVTITDNNFCIPTELYLEVINATNATTAASATSNSVVLLNDVSGSFSVSGGHTFYGNGFTVTLPTSHASAWGDGFTGYVNLNNGNLDNVRIVGPVYPEQYIYRDQAGDSTNGCTYFKNAVNINKGDCVITNSYISGARTAVYIKDGGNVVFDNTTVEGGSYANIQVSVSDSVTFRDYTSIQKETDNSYGVTASDGGTKKVIGLGVVIDDVNTVIKIEGTLNQHNWINQSQWSNMLGSYVNAFPKLFTDSAYANYRHYRVNDSSTPYVDLTFIFACDWDSTKVNDNRTDKSITYALADASVAGMDGGVYSVVNAGTLTDDLYIAEEYLPSEQYPVEPVYSFDFVNKNYQEKTVDSNVYCYHDGSEVQISFDEGGSKVWDTSILTLEKNGNDIAYTVTMNGTDYTGKSITFDENGTYEVVYSYTDEYNYKLGEDGSIIQYSKEYTKSVNIVVTEVAKLAQNASFAFGKSGLPAEKVTVGNDTYLSVTGVDTSTLTNTASATLATSESGTASYSVKYNSDKTYGSATIDGNTFYFPIASMGTTDGKWEHTGSWYGCFPVFDGVVTITDYADGGEGAEVVYNSSTTTMPSNLVAIYPQITFVYQGTVSKVPTTPSKMTKGTYSGKLCYTTQTDLTASNERGEVWTIAKYEYKDNAGKTYYYYVCYYCAKSTNGGCVTPETLITLADGSQKEVQDLTGEEMLLVWNHTTGAYDEAPVAYIVNHDTEDKEHEIITLTFDDGKEMEIIGEHVFFDVNEKKYVTLDSNAETFIGTEFAVNSDSGLASAKLINVEKEYRNTRAYEVVTYKHMTCFTENILSASAYMDKLLNVFDIDDTYAYNSEKMAEDIETYGLYTYEDFKDIVPEKTFELYNAAYLKVAVGKGYITWDDILALVEVYNDLGIVPMK